VGPRAGLDAVMKEKKFPVLAGIRTFDHPAPECYATELFCLLSVPYATV